MRPHERDKFAGSPPKVLDPKYLHVLRHRGEPVCLGAGSYSVVCQAQSTVTGTLYAVKLYLASKYCCLYSAKLKLTSTPNKYRYWESLLCHIVPYKYP